MKYCPECGTKLQLKYNPRVQKELPYCDGCAAYKYPGYNTAVSMIVTDEREENVILIKQYGRDSFILVAGYVDKGESAEQAVAREVMEELGLETIGLRFNRSSYFERSNTLMLNFTCVVSSLAARPNSEVDYWQVFSHSGAAENIRHGSLAEEFLLAWLKDKSKNKNA